MDQARTKTILDRYRDSAKLPRKYPDLHDHVLALAAAGKLIVIDEPVNKDTEMHPLVRWQYRGGIAEDARRGFLFDNVTDGKNRKFNCRVLVGGLSGRERDDHLHGTVRVSAGACTLREGRIGGCQQITYRSSKTENWINHCPTDARKRC